MNFDSVAFDYDRQFTYSRIGILQRNRVWNYLNCNFPLHPPLSILELNCGTGEDAIHLAGQGHYVVATDTSQNMVEVTLRKINENRLSEKIKVFQVPIENILSLPVKAKFDMVFSDFGGLNCLTKESLIKLSSDLPQLLNRGGRAVLVLMPRFCWWETLYFILKGNFKNAFRRMNGCTVSEDYDNTWYYSPSEIQKIFSSQFKLKKLQPIGILIPPSYLEPFFSNKPKTLALLDKAENYFKRISLFSIAADHYLADLELR